jgi:hypothetical protein
MRSLILLLLVAPSLLLGQICPNDPSPIALDDFGRQVIDADCFENEEYLNSLNPVDHSLWNIGTNISDNNLTSRSNDQIMSFITVKLRNTPAPNDNLANAGNAYLVDSGYSPDIINGEESTGGGDGLSKWNVIMYVALDEESGANFENVNVLFHIDFDPAECYDVSQMASLNIGDELANQQSDGNLLSAFGINSNLGFDYLEALNPGADFDALVNGYYTFAIEVQDHCGNQKMWNEITVHVGTSVNPESSVALDGAVELEGPVENWASTNYITSTSGSIAEDGISWSDYPGRLEDGRFSVSRVYSIQDVCGNTSEVGQLLIADESNPSGCTNDLALNYASSAVNDDGNCDYSPACPGDLNYDGVIATTDLLTLLASFGLPCP